MDDSLQPTLKAELREKKKKVWSVYGGIIAVLFILIFETAIWLSMLTYILNSCNMCVKIFEENALHLLMGEVLYSTMITQDQKYWIPLTIFTRLCTNWFLSFSLSTKYSEWQKIFFKKTNKNRQKKSCKTSWARNQVYFTWEESTGNLINESGDSK